LAPALALALVQGALAFSGCGGSSSSPDAGPACEPACLDAPLDGLVDSFVPPVDAGPSCDAACAPQTNAKGCPFPGCLSECQRQQDFCDLAFQRPTFDTLLTCEAHATYTCKVTDAGFVLPSTHDCDDAAAAVAKKCIPSEAGMADAGACGAELTMAACALCCQGSFSEGHDTYELALTSCACNSPAPCASACANEQCMDMVPKAGDSCSKCLDESLAPDGGCSSQVSKACALDPNCAGYETCLTHNCATLK